MTETQYNSYKTSFYTIYSDLQHSVACRLKYGLSCVKEIEYLKILTQWKKTIDQYDINDPKCVNDDIIKLLVSKAQTLKFKKATCSEPAVQSTQGESPSIPAEIVDQFEITGKSANIWYFGAYCGLDFSEGEPTLLTDSQMIQGEGCSVLSDGTGQLIAYTDGTSLWDKNHNLVKWDNGDDVSVEGTPMKGSTSSLQSGIFANIPGSSGQYLIFTSPVNGGSEDDYHMYSFNAKANGGVGELSNEVNITADTNNKGSEAICLIRKNNNVDWWVILFTGLNNVCEYRVHEITLAGFNQTPTQTYTIGDTFQEVAQMKASFDGSKLAITAYATNYTGYASVYDFDNSTGIISGRKKMIPALLKARIYSLEFSPNNQYIYISVTGPAEDNNTYIFLYDVVNNAILSNGQGLSHLYVKNTGYVINAALQYGPDGRIYYSLRKSNENITKLSYINNPNGGMNSTIVYYDNPANTVLASGNVNSYIQAGLPYFPKSYFKI